MELLKLERNTILNLMKTEKDPLCQKQLKNKYHAISNKISYIKHHDEIIKSKYISNTVYHSNPDVKQKKREYAREYMRNKQNTSQK